jgi:6-phosphogluconolactonase (cycloisomerase 2 family)
MSNVLRSVAGAAVAAVAIATPAVAAHGDTHSRSDAAVFVQTDSTSGNQVLAYHRGANGQLTYVASYATGGNGATAQGASADPLASQHSLVTTDDGHVLLAVNAGSNTVSVFRVDGTRLRLRQTIASDGAFPASIAAHGNLVYVLNAGGAGDVAGFWLRHGRLHELGGSSRTLGLGNTTPPNFLASPGQVGFSPDGTQLIVTTKASTSSIDVFSVGRHGRLAATPTSNASATPVPFAFAWGPNDSLIVAEAKNSTVSTYTLNPTGTTTLLGSTPDGQGALCWITEARGYYYVSNAGSANVSAYTLNGAGQPVLVGIAGTTQAGTTDSAAAAHGRFLYVENGGTGSVSEFAVSGAGQLTNIGTVAGLPTGIEGIATVN